MSADSIAEPAYDKMTVEQLKNELRAKKLLLKGTKADMIGRLEAWLPSSAVESEMPPFVTMKVSELQSYCREYGLPVSGSKQLLVGRLADKHMSRSKEHPEPIHSNSASDRQNTSTVTETNDIKRYCQT